MHNYARADIQVIALRFFGFPCGSVGSSPGGEGPRWDVKSSQFSGTSWAASSSSSNCLLPPMPKRSDSSGVTPQSNPPEESSITSQGCRVRLHSPSYARCVPNWRAITAPPSKKNGGPRFPTVASVRNHGLFSRELVFHFGVACVDPLLKAIRLPVPMSETKFGEPFSRRSQNRQNRGQRLRPVGVMKTSSSVTSRRLREFTLLWADPVVALIGTSAAHAPSGPVSVSVCLSHQRNRSRILTCGLPSSPEVEMFRSTASSLISSTRFFSSRGAVVFSARAGSCLDYGAVPPRDSCCFHDGAYLSSESVWASVGDSPSSFFPALDHSPYGKPLHPSLPGRGAPSVLRLLPPTAGHLPIQFPQAPPVRSHGALPLTFSPTI